MKKMKKAMALIMCFVLCMGALAGCSGKPTAAKETTKAGQDETTTAESQGASAVQKAVEKAGDKDHIVIGTSIYFMTEFCVLMVEGMQEEAERQNAELVVLDAKNDASLQLNQIENLISQQVDSIIISPVNSDAAEPALDLCEAAGIPISAVNMTITTDRDYYYVGPNEIQAGELAAQWLIDNVGEDAKVCIIQGPIGCSAQIFRDEGIFNVLDEHPGVEVLAIKPGDWNRNTAVSLTENWLTTYGDELDAIISHDDDMGLGVVRALQSAGKLKDMKVIACADGIEEACESVKAGEMSVTFFQDVFREGELSVEMAAKLARGEKIEEQQVLIDMIPTEKEYAQELLEDYYGPRK
ncbi:substrate-binding domain-containing protein [Lacrimispora sp. NSJ-141]|uniref:Substrate-binding domain-containing protein n=1 Tax=Lientehia hominis TaxID=2897778 RepID=A0AAP2RK98_9FIRM|nr:substrate-binding domain-containing protein [Lientehia hominis]MCD2493190.1 substrate-binding domain-containing protein [Lientehia hominis]